MISLICCSILGQLLSNMCPTFWRMAFPCIELEDVECTEKSQSLSDQKHCEPPWVMNVPAFGGHACFPKVSEA